MNRIKVLHIVKWFPNKEDVQNGVFIEKHVESVSPYTSSSVLFFKEIEDQSQKVIIEKSNADGYNKYIVYHKPISKLNSFLLKQRFLKKCISEVGIPDIIHLHIMSNDQWIAYNFAKQKNIPLFISEHWSGYIDSRFQNFSFLKRKMYEKMVSYAYMVMPVSNFLKKGMLNCDLNGNYNVVPNVVETDVEDVKKHKNFTFLMVSDLVDDNKNISGVIRSFIQLKNQGNLALHIIGDGPDKEVISTLVSQSKLKSIKLLGRLKNQDAISEMSRCHCLIVNSKIETFSVVALEARALGLHVISTKCGGPEENLDEYARFISSESELLEAMQSVTDDELPPRMSMDLFNYKGIGSKLYENYSNSFGIVK